MGSRRWSIRLRIFLLVALPILSLIVLYAFAATTTTSDAINLSRTKTLKDTIGTPTVNLEPQVEAERPLAVIYLGAPVAPSMAALHAPARTTEQAHAGSAATAAEGRAVRTPPRPRVAP